MDRDVIVQGNPRVYKALRNRMDDILAELKRISIVNEFNEEKATLLKDIILIMERMREDTG